MVMVRVKCNSLFSSSPSMKKGEVRAPITNPSGVNNTPRQDAMANCMRQLDWPRDAELVDETLFLGVPVMAFLRLTFEWVDWGKMPHCRRASSNLLRAWIENRRPSKGEVVFCLSWTSIFSCIPASVLPVLRPLDSNWALHCWLPWVPGLRVSTGTMPPTFLGLQLADNKFLASTSVTAWATLS